MSSTGETAEHIDNKDEELRDISYTGFEDPNRLEPRSGNVTTSSHKQQTERFLSEYLRLQGKPSKTNEEVDVVQRITRNMAELDSFNKKAGGQTAQRIPTQMQHHLTAKNKEDTIDETTKHQTATSESRGVGTPRREPSELKPGKKSSQESPQPTADITQPLEVSVRTFLPSKVVEALKVNGLYEGDDATIDARWQNMSTGDQEAAITLVLKRAHEGHQLEGQRQWFTWQMRAILTMLSITQLSDFRNEAKIWRSADSSSPQYPTPWYSLPNADNVKDPFTYSARAQPNSGSYCNSVGLIQTLRSLIERSIADPEFASPQKLGARNDFTRLVAESRVVERMGTDSAAEDKSQAALWGWLERADMAQDKWVQTWFRMKDGVVELYLSSGTQPLEKRTEPKGDECNITCQQEETTDTAAAERHEAKADVDMEVNQNAENIKTESVKMANDDKTIIETGPSVRHEKEAKAPGRGTLDTTTWVRGLFGVRSATDKITLPPEAMNLSFLTRELGTRNSHGEGKGKKKERGKK
ncbi:hypothetical protein K491DRAFT_750603 [Lophiostoma macrostomum CBS 122681]|uniref:Uncharacterized protein n=1 Tax=Lophiostoma macrostomum CBS 122681 TaxID=1314788 RepID=A0A6A6T4G2_9PLEO|nr:hypothetical protein K491DRAFT_750603 [Lophiostoma macrostomum CBS 122681]